MRLDLILQGRFPEEGVGLLLALSRTLRGTLRRPSELTTRLEFFIIRRCLLLARLWR